MMPQSATQGTQGTPPPVPPIPKMEAGPPGARTRQEVRQQVRENARAAAQRAVEAVQSGAPGTLTLPPPSAPPQTTPGTAPAPSFPQEDIPLQVMNLIYMSMVFAGVIILGFPIVRAFTRRFDRKTEALRSGGPDVTPQLNQLQDSVDAMAVELERISEAQRFTAKLLSERAPAQRAEENVR